MLEIARLSTAEPGFDARLKALTSFGATFDEEVERKVVEICENVRNRGDAAVLEYNENPEWGDRVKAVRVAELELKPSVLEQARAGLERTQRDALEQAAARIRISRATSRSDGGSQTRSCPHRLGPSCNSNGCHVAGSISRPPQPHSTMNDDGVLA